MESKDFVGADGLTNDQRVALGGFSTLPGSAVYASLAMAAMETENSGMGLPLPFPVKAAA